MRLLGLLAALTVFCYIDGPAVLYLLLLCITVLRGLALLDGLLEPRG